MTREKIAKLLLKIKAVDLNTNPGFTYASGRKGPIYCDNRLIYSYPEQREHVIDAFLSLINDKQLEFDIVAGVATGAIGWGAFIADRLKKPFIYIKASKKDHGKGNQIEGEFEEGKKVLIIEDLINTGGSSLAAVEALKEVSCTVTAMLAIFNYGLDDASKNFTEANVSLYSLSDFHTLVKVAQETEFINANEKKSLMEWHSNPKDWD